MDTSEQYIEMCRKAKELQEGWNPQIGDWIYQNSALPDKITVVYKYSLEKEDMKIWDWVREDWYTMQECIWLPRIDQLIDMLGNDLRPDEGFTMTIKNRKTTEQELLNEHYKNTYHKSWNGEDWI